MKARRYVLLLAVLTSCEVSRLVEEPPCSLASIVEPYSTEAAVINDNGAWAWFTDERALVLGDTLVVGSVRSVGTFAENQNDPGWGNVELAIHDFVADTTRRVVLYPRFEQDDHDSPALLLLPDRAILAAYARHSVERRLYVQRSEPGLPSRWPARNAVETPGVDALWGGDNVTYSTLLNGRSGEVLLFHRGVGSDPNLLVSTDGGQNWSYRGRVLEGRDGYSPYLKYARADGGRIHIIGTEDHPRNYDNSLYHGYLEGDSLYTAAGTFLGRVSGSEPPAAVWDLTEVFHGDPDHVAWIIDAEVGPDERPWILFSVQRDGRGKLPGEGGFDLRYYYGRWNGSRWSTEEIAYAGTRLYAGEDDYAGSAALDPTDPDVAYISANVDPASGKPLVSRSDGRQHYELFRGERLEEGWTWKPITVSSPCDNLRPIVPAHQAGVRGALVWMRGRYLHNRGEWSTAVVATRLPE